MKELMPSSFAPYGHPSPPFHSPSIGPFSLPRRLSFSLLLFFYLLSWPWPPPFKRACSRKKYVVLIFSIPAKSIQIFPHFPKFMGRGMQFRRPFRSSRLCLAIPLILGSIAFLSILFDGGGQRQNVGNLLTRAKRHAAPFEGRMDRRKAFLGFQCHKRNKTNSGQIDAPQHDGSQFPDDMFTMEQRRRGAVFLHLFGLIYMFIALAIVCDEFFVPSLGVITEKLDISDDVAGATFMAAGGSAPEFFTSVVGTFIAQNNVGIGTIVGSATFNILCVLAFCTLFSHDVLQLSWWPLFRDVSFYVISLLILVGAFLDEQIVWWEAAALFAVYLAYALFMKFNAKIELCIKKQFGCQIDEGEEGEEEEEEEEAETKETDGQIADEKTSKAMASANPKAAAATELLAQHNLQQQKEWMRRGHASLQRSDTVCAQGTNTRPFHNPRGSMRRRQSSIPGSSRRQSIPILHSGAMFRNGIISLMSQTLDPLSEGTDHGREGEGGGGKSGRSQSNSAERNKSGQNGQSGQMLLQLNGAMEQQPILKKRDQNGNSSSRRSTGPEGGGGRSTKVDFEEIKSVLEEEGEQPLDMSWPRRWHKQILYIFLAPILFPLWLTMADVRREEKRKYFPLTFFLSILWIAAFSYLMVWWANTIGLTLGIPTEVLGLTILAAGTSIPDLITSVIVARKGLGDMAVSSSVGSNIFDVCVGLPIPWLLYFFWDFLRLPTSAHSIHSVPVSSNGLVCSVGMLFLMLLLLLAAVALCGWRMNKAFGCTMIAAYLVFCALSIALEVGRLACPLRLC